MELLQYFLKNAVTSRCSITRNLCVTAAGNEIFSKNFMSDLRTLVGNCRGKFLACNRYLEIVD